MKEDRFYYTLILSLTLHAAIWLAVTVKSRNMAVSMPLDISLIEAISSSKAPAILKNDTEEDENKLLPSMPSEAPKILQNNTPDSSSVSNAERVDFAVKKTPSVAKTQVAQPKFVAPVSPSLANEAIKKDKIEAVTVQKKLSDDSLKADVETQPVEETHATHGIQTSNVSDDSLKTDVETQPAGETHATPSIQTSNVAITPPQFGAAYLNNPRPGYPAAAKRMRMEGIVTLKVFVNREGRAIKVELAKSSGYDILDMAAIETVKNWLFVPARQGESTVDEWVHVPVAFRLNK